MSMQFTWAIENAATLMLFDTLSQQRLAEIAAQAEERSLDYYLIRLSQASLYLHNVDQQEPSKITETLARCARFLRQLRGIKAPPSLAVMALFLELDILLHRSRLTLEEDPQNRQLLFNDDDKKAYLLGKRLMSSLPGTLNPLPDSWHSAFIPLMPRFRQQIMEFYQEKTVERRAYSLSEILIHIRSLLHAALGIILAKQYLVQHTRGALSEEDIRRWFCQDLGKLRGVLGEQLARQVQIMRDPRLPRGVSRTAMMLAISENTQHLQEVSKKGDRRIQASAYFKQGTLAFMAVQPQHVLHALSETLDANKQLTPQEKAERQQNHALFPDLPFMVGTAYLWLAKPLLQARTKGVEAQRNDYLKKAESAFMQAILLQPTFHDAYVNLALVSQLLNSPHLERLYRLYLDRFGGDIKQLKGTVFVNRAFLINEGQHVAHQPFLPESYKWLLLSRFCSGGSRTAAGRMLRDLKSLFILQGHGISAGYLRLYQQSLMREPSFAEDLKNPELHSAILFYLAHAFTYLSLPGHRKQVQDDGQIMDYQHFARGIRLNGQALFFNPQNPSALSLISTQRFALRFALRKSEQRWETANHPARAQRAYEEYLRQMQCHALLSARIQTLKLSQPLPRPQFSAKAEANLFRLFPAAAQNRLQSRVASEKASGVT